MFMISIDFFYGKTSAETDQAFDIKHTRFAHPTFYKNLIANFLVSEASAEFVYEYDIIM